MVGFYAFQPSISGLQAQGAALAAISTNIANATTDGYKRAETAFATVMSRTIASAPAMPGASAPRNAQSDLGGVAALTLHRIAAAGPSRATGNALDAAINGNGFFVLAPDVARPSDAVFGRAGHFGLLAAPTGQGGLLADANGFAVLGWPVAANGSVATTAAPMPITIDFDAITTPGRATTQVAVAGDLAATAAVGSAVTLGLETYDGAGELRPLALTVTKQAANSWSVAVDAGAGRSVMLTPPAFALAFDALGQPLPPTQVTVAVSEAGSPLMNLTLDLSQIRQQGGASALSFAQDGYPGGALNAIAFDAAGRVIGSFSNGRTQPLYQLAIASFINPDGLAPVSGTVYAPTELSGLPSLGVAGDAARGTIMPGAIEQSNVDLEEEFSRMILVQHAYNSASMAFRTVDEMTQVARDLKRV
jgi:flagellar hook protein FlgE